MTRRWLHSADVEIDDQSRALLVKIVDVEVKVDVAETDVASIVTGIAGSTPKTLSDLDARLAALSSSAQAGSGLTAKTTTDDSPTTVIAADAAHAYRHFRIFNSGSTAGFYSFNGGTTWHYLPAACSLHHDGVAIANQAIQVKRIAGGDDLSGVFASVW